MNLALAEFELPIRISRDRPVSDEELMRLSAESRPLRLERDANGELIVMSPTGSEGGGIETDVATELNIWARSDGRGRAFGSNTGFRLPDSSVRAADAAWVSWDRWNSVSREERKGYAPICPEFVIEVRSESDKVPDLQAKMAQWIANGAEVAWLIDPIDKAVTIYRPGDQPEHLAHPTSVHGTGPIAGFELVMARIWE
jgi:Uma2 family endonuclease